MIRAFILAHSFIGLFLFYDLSSLFIHELALFA